MLADIPFTSIERHHLEDLVSRGARENRRLDFKRTLDLSHRQKLVDFLQDVVSMANVDGGLIVYGIDEGRGENAGVATSLSGMIGNIDALSNLIDQITNDHIDEPVRVLHREIPLDDGRFAFLVRVPASPLAPHMVASINTSSARFYARANTSNQPMTARQIKEAALRHGAAVERAARRIEERVSLLQQLAAERRNRWNGESASPSQALLHIVPLFPHARGWNYADATVSARLKQVLPFGYSQQYHGGLVYTQHGAFERNRDVRHTGFLRDGTLEFQQYDIVTSGIGETGPIVTASDIEGDIATALLSAQELSAEGYLPPPLLIQFHLSRVEGTRLQGVRNGPASVPVLTDSDIATDALVLTDWTGSDQLLKELLDHLWQAWGYPSCQHFDGDGNLMRFTLSGAYIRSAPMSEEQ